MSKQLNEPDNPNTIAIYIIISISLITLVASFAALKEYKGYIKSKRDAIVELRPFVERDVITEYEAARKAIVESQLKAADKKDFPGL